MSEFPISDEVIRRAAIAQYEAGRRAVEPLRGPQNRYSELLPATQDGLDKVAAAGIQAFLQAEGFEVSRGKIYHPDPSIGGVVSATRLISSWKPIPEPTSTEGER